MPPERRTSKTTRQTRVPAARAIPPKKDPTLMIAGGVGGGALFLLIVIAVASSGGTKPRPAPPPPPPPAVVEKPVERDTRSASETGAILFICGGSTKHEDKEVILSRCPSCSAHDRFYWDGGRYVCQACYKPFDNAKIVCDCGKAPRVHRIKHR